jgi:hypothetical protein
MKTVLLQFLYLSVRWIETFEEEQASLSSSQVLLSSLATQSHNYSTSSPPGSV